MATAEQRFRLVYLAYPYGSGCAWPRGRSKEQVREEATRKQVGHAQ